jgi:hypothetical protein
MKSLMLSMSVLVSAALAAPVVAAEKSNPNAAALSATTVQAVSAFVGSYAQRDSQSRAQNLVLYPTSSREAVFVTYHASGTAPQADHIGLISLRGGRVTRYSDLTGAQPRRVPMVAAANRDDAQSQAGALLVTAVPQSQPGYAEPVLASREVPASAQSQAAEVLRAAPTVRHEGEPRRVLAMAGPVVHGDSQAMARGVLTMTSGE